MIKALTASQNAPDESAQAFEAADEKNYSKFQINNVNMH